MHEKPDPPLKTPFEAQGKHGGAPVEPKVSERSFGAKARLRMTTKIAGLKAAATKMPGSSPFGAQGKPALRKAPGPLTNEKRERALGYKIAPILKDALRNLRASRVGHP